MVSSRYLVRLSKSGHELAATILDHEPVLIGRWSSGDGDPTPQLRLGPEAVFVSRRHCHLVNGPRGPELFDGWPGHGHGSTFGTHVDGKRIEHQIIVPEGRVVLGDPVDPQRHVELNVELIDDSLGDDLAQGATTPFEIVSAGQAKASPPQGDPRLIKTAPAPLPKSMSQLADDSQRESPAQSPAPKALGPKGEAANAVASAPASPTQEPAPLPPAPKHGPLSQTLESIEAVGALPAPRVSCLVLIGPTQAVVDDAGLPTEQVAWKGRELEFDESSSALVIGRSAVADMVVWDPDPGINRRVSRRHCELRLDVDNRSFRLHNLSGNGTFLRRLDRAVTGVCDLEDGDVLVIGSTTLEFRIEGTTKSISAAKLSTGASKAAILSGLIGSASLVAGALGQGLVRGLGLGLGVVLLITAVVLARR